MRIVKKRWFLLLLLILLLSGGYLSLRTVEVTSYMSEEVRLEDIEVTILADGKMEAFEQVDVGAQVSGQIQKINVTLGEQVKKGQLIVEIDDLPQQNNLKDSEARLKNTISSKVAKEAQLVNGRINAERQRRLIKNGATTQSDLDLAEANLKVLNAELDALEAQVAQAQIALDTAKLDLSYTKIRAPIDGTIVAKIVKEGQTVNAVQTAPTLVKIANLDTMTIKAQISEADVTKVKIGMKATFTILGEPNKRYEAVLRQIEPATENFQNTAIGNTATDVGQAIYYNGLFDVKNSESKFYIDMTTQIYLVTDSADNTLTIPSMAVRFKPSDYEIPKATKGKAIVWILKNGDKNHLEPREVVLGITNNIRTEIKSGLNAGDYVVTSELKKEQRGGGISHPRGIPKGFR